MKYGRYVGRVGALAVALGIGVAVANGGVANATTDPDPPDTSDTGNQNPENPTVDKPGTDTPQNPEGPETPPVAINGVEQNGNEGATTHRRIKPRVLLDILRGANVLGARQPVDRNPAPVKQPDANERQGAGVEENTDGTVAKLTAPTGSDPVKQVVQAPRALQRTLAAIAAPTKPKIAPSAKVLPGPTKPVTVLDSLTTQTQRQATTITGPSTLADPLPPPPPPRPSPVRFVLNLLSAVGLRPEAFPPGSPLAPVGQLLEFVYAGLRRIDHELFNQGPQESVLVQNPDSTSGVINGRVAYDPDDPLVMTTVAGEGPQHGTVAFHDDGTFTYTPNYNEKILPGTTDSFTVQVTEATTDHLHQAGDVHTITVEVNNFQVAPNLAVVDTLPNTPDATHPNGVLKDPPTVAVTPDGTRAYVVVNGTNEVRVIDTSTNELIGNPIAVGSGPLRIAINNAGTRAYVTGDIAGSIPSRDQITVIDIDPTSTNYNTVIATVPLGAAGDVIAAEDVAVSPDGSRVYVTTFFDDGKIYVIDAATNTVIGTKTFVDDDNPAETEDNIGKMEFNPVASRNLAYITNVDDDEVLVVNTDPASAGYMTVVKRIPIAGVGTAQGIAVSADGNRAYVVSNDGTVAVVNTDPTSGASYNTVVKTITVGVGDPLSYNGIAVRGNRVYVPVLPADTIAVIDTDTNTVITSIPVNGNNPFDVAVTPEGAGTPTIYLYVPNIGAVVGNGSPDDSDDSVSVIRILEPEEM